MRRLLLCMAFVAACNDTTGEGRTSCKADSECPFEQCCVASVCTNPGIVGVCANADGTASTIIADKASPVAGVDTVMLTATLRDAFGRPIANRDVSIVVSSNCPDSAPQCDVLTPGAAGTTDAQGHVVATLSSQISGDKTVTLSTASPVVSATVTFVGGPPVGIGYGRSSFEIVLGQSLGSVSVGFVDQFGNFTKQATAQPVTMSLVPNGANINLTDARGAPLSAEALTYDIAPGPVALSSAYIPIAGHGFQLRLSDHVSPVIKSPLFDVTTPPLTAAAASPATIAPGETSTITWTTSASSVLTSAGATVSTSSPANVQPSASTEYVAATTDTRPSSLRTALADPATWHPVSGDGAVHIAHVLQMSNGDLVIAGDFTTQLNLGAVILTPPSGVVQRTAFIARMTGDATSTVWHATLGADDSTVKDLVNIGGELAVTIDYHDPDATFGWTSDADPYAPDCTFSSATDQRSTGIARIEGNGNFRWCTSIRGYATGNDVRPGGLVATSSASYVLIAGCDNMFGQPKGGGDTTYNLHGGGLSELAIVKLDDSGNITQLPYASGTYTFTPGGLYYDASADRLTIVGSAYSSGSEVIYGSGVHFTTNGTDAVVIGLHGANYEWSWFSNAPGTDQATGGAIDELGNVAIAGTFNGAITNPPLAAPVTNGSDGFVIGFAAHAPIWANALRSATPLSGITMHGDDTEMIVVASGQQSIAVDNSVAGVASSAAVSLMTAFTWNGMPFWSRPVPGATSGFAHPRADGGAYYGVDGTPTTLGVLEAQSLTASAPVQFVFGQVAPYDFARVRVTVSP